MIDLLTISIGAGLVVSLLFAEFYGFKAGGLVVPGYFALFLTDPKGIFLTTAIALITYFAVRLTSSIVVVYGKRRTALAILFGYFLGAITRVALRDSTLVTGTPVEAELIGYIIPGLVALWMDRQGILETLTSLATVSIVTRLALIVLVPHQLETFLPRAKADPSLAGTIAAQSMSEQPDRP